MPVPPYVDPASDEWTALNNLKEYQIRYNGYDMGVGANGVEWKEIDGLDISNMRTGDSGRPRDQGEFIGYDFLSGRDITFKLDVQNSSGNSLLENILALSTAFLPQSNIETPLYMNLPNGPWEYSLVAVMCRPRNRSWKIDIAYSLGNLAQDLQVMVHATDPRFYAFPVYNDSFTGTSSTFVNTGNYDCRPRITLSTPSGDDVENPYISCTQGTVTRTLYLGSGTSEELPHGTTLSVDLYDQTLWLDDPITPYHGPWYWPIQTGSQWFTLNPGTSTFETNCYATVYWASAWIL